MKHFIIFTLLLSASAHSEEKANKEPVRTVANSTNIDKGSLGGDFSVDSYYAVKKYEVDKHTCVVSFVSSPRESGGAGTSTFCFKNGK
jgi:hypothetical protein